MVLASENPGVQGPWTLTIKDLPLGGGGVQSQASGDQFEHQGSRRGGADVNLTVLLCQVVLCSGVFRLMI